MKNADEIIKAVSAKKQVAISVITAREMARRACAIHAPSPVVSIAMGRMLSIASIIGSDMKKEDASLTVRIDGGGPVGAIIVVTDSGGNPRCFVSNPGAVPQGGARDALDVGSVVGSDGVLTVIRDLRGKAPYIGTTRLISGEIAEDFAVYFAESEQVRSVCALGVLLGEDGSVVASGGYVARLLPGAPDEVIDILEKNIAGTPAVTELLKNDGGARLLLESVMDGLSPRILSRSPVEYRCTCSRERFKSAVLSLSRSELEDIRKKGEPVETSCQFCKSVYEFPLEEIF